MEIAVESEMLAIRTLKSDGPQNSCLVILIECILCVNKEEFPVLLLGMLFPQEVHQVNAPLGAFLQP